MKVKPTHKRGRVLVQVDRKDEPLLAGKPAAAFELHHLLVPVDFSDCSKKALQYAAPLARSFSARITVLYVLPTNYYIGSEFGPVDFPVPEGEWKENSLRELAALVKSELDPSTAAECAVRQGQPAHEIATFARENEVDLILISTHGRTGLRHVMVGSVAENVVRYAPCPVLVVREQERDFIPTSRRRNS